MSPPQTPPDEVRVAFVMVPDAEIGAEIARALVDERLAACVNLVPGARSFYRWEGALQEDSELLMIVKTREGRVAALAKRLAEIHPYDLPELLTMPTEGGSEAYLRWVVGETSP